MVLPSQAFESEFSSVKTSSADSPNTIELSRGKLCRQKYSVLIFICEVHYPYCAISL